MLRTSLFSLVVALFLGGCASSGMTSTQHSEIPDGANAVVLHSDRSPDELYRSVYQSLRQRGFRMEESNEEMHSLSTNGKATGESRIQMRIDVLVEENGDGSTLTARADARIGQFGWMDAHKSSRTEKVTVAFEELVLLAEDFPHESIEYQAG